MNPLYYQPSNKTPLGGLLLLLLGGTAVAAALALVYIYAIWYIPFIYLNVLVCLAFGFALGTALAYLVKAGKLRNPRVVAGLALLVGAAAIYLEWCVYLTLLFNAETTGTGANADTSTSFSASTFGTALTNPGLLWEAVRQLNETGSWSLKGTTPSGIFLWIIWLLEAGIIVGLTYLLAPAQARHPFSETTNTWATEEVMPQLLRYVSDPPALRQSLESGHFEGLMPASNSDEAANFARLTLHRADDDDNCQYLSLENIVVSFDKKGKRQESTTTLVPHLALSASSYRTLHARFGTAVTGSVSTPAEIQ